MAAVWSCAHRAEGEVLDAVKTALIASQVGCVRTATSMLRDMLLAGSWFVPPYLCPRVISFETVPLTGRRGAEDGSRASNIAVIRELSRSKMRARNAARPCAVEVDTCSRFTLPTPTSIPPP